MQNEYGEVLYTYHLASFSGDVFCSYRALSKPRNWLAPLIQLTTELIQISPFFFCMPSVFVCLYVCVCVFSHSVMSTLCDSMGSSPPGSSVCEILQARVLEWVAMSSSKGSSQPWGQTLVSCSSCTGGFFLSLGLEKEMATHSSILAWKITMNRGA